MSIWEAAKADWTICSARGSWAATQRGGLSSPGQSVTMSKVEASRAGDLKPVEDAGDAVAWTPRDVWLGVILLLAWGAALVAIQASGWLTSEKIDPGLYVGLAELVFLLPVWWYTVRKYGVGLRALGLRRFRAASIGLGCGLLLGSFAFNLFYNLFLALFGQRAQVDLVPVMARLSSPWFLLVAAALVAPVVEELFFRGFVYAGLRQRFGWVRAALVSSALFSVLHLQPLGIPPIFLLGLMFAFLYERSRSLWPAILMHVTMNALAVGAAYLASQMGGMLDVDTTELFSSLLREPTGVSPLPTPWP
jgi:membrane protease YdiL (CAAX protease family)